MPPETEPPSPDELHAAFALDRPFSVGIEEEAMLLDPRTLDLAPRAREVVDAAGGNPRLKLELPAAQLEVVTEPAPDVDTAVAQLAEGRRALLAACEDRARPALAGLHPFAAGEGQLNEDERYRRTAAKYGPVARRQLVCALQVHVAVGGPDRALAVYNSLRSHLPELAALSANSPFHEGRDTGFASYRPKVAEALPRQGVPPAFESWDAFARALRWGAASGTVPEPRVWWWELRPHPAFGTLELRVPDSQTTLAEAAAVAHVAHGLVAWLAARHDAGERLPVHDTWRIEENRWSACHAGLDGTLADLDSGERVATRERLTRLLNELETAGGRTAEARELLLERNGAHRQREVAERAGLPGLAAWLADRFPPDATEAPQGG